MPEAAHDHGSAWSCVDEPVGPSLAPLCRVGVDHRHLAPDRHLIGHLTHFKSDVEPLDDPSGQVIVDIDVLLETGQLRTEGVGVRRLDHRELEIAAVIADGLADEPRVLIGQGHRYPWNHRARGVDDGTQHGTGGGLRLRWCQQEGDKRRDQQHPEISPVVHDLSLFQKKTD